MADHFHRTRGVEADPRRVVVFPGGKPPIGMSQMAYCSPGDEVIYPSPGYPIYESFVASVGARPVPIHLTEESGFTLSGAEIEAADHPAHAPDLPELPVQSDGRRRVQGAAWRTSPR